MEKGGIFALPGPNGAGREELRRFRDKVGILKRAVGACADILGIQRDFACRHYSRGADYGIPLVGRHSVVAGRGRHPRAVYAGPDLGSGDSRTDRKIVRGRGRLFLSAHFPAVHQLGVRADENDAGAGSSLCRAPAGHLHCRRGPLPARGAACRQ